MLNSAFKPRKRWVDWLESRGFEGDLERQYRLRQEKYALPLTRALLLLASLGVLLFGLWDHTIDPTASMRTLPVRLLCSAMSLTLWAALPLPMFRNRLSWIFPSIRSRPH